MMHYIKFELLLCHREIISPSAKAIDEEFSLIYHVCVSGLTPLHAAMINGDVAMAQMLLAHGAYVEVLVEPDGRAPIHIGVCVCVCVCV